MPDPTPRIDKPLTVSQYLARRVNDALAEATQVRFTHYCQRRGLTTALRSQFDALWSAFVAQSGEPLGG